jgi:cell division protein YceG involved in septum cleavage
MKNFKFKLSILMCCLLLFLFLSLLKTKQSLNDSVLKSKNAFSVKNNLATIKIKKLLELKKDIESLKFEIYSKEWSQKSSIIKKDQN